MRQQRRGFSVSITSKGRAVTQPPRSTDADKKRARPNNHIHLSTFFPSCFSSLSNRWCPSFSTGVHVEKTFGPHPSRGSTEMSLGPLEERRLKEETCTTPGTSSQRGSMRMGKLMPFWTGDEHGQGPLAKKAEVLSFLYLSYL